MVKRGPAATVIVPPNQNLALLSPVTVRVPPEGPLVVTAQVHGAAAGAAPGRVSANVMVNGEVIGESVLKMDIPVGQTRAVLVVHELAAPAVGDVVGVLVSTGGAPDVTGFTEGESWLQVGGVGFVGE